MSNQPITIEVRSSEAKLARTVGKIAAIITLVLLVISTYAFITGDMSLATITGIIALAVIIIGIIVYNIIAFIGSMDIGEAKSAVKIIVIAVPGSLAFLFLLLWILGGI